MRTVLERLRGALQQHHVHAALNLRAGADPERVAAVWRDITGYPLPVGVAAFLAVHDGCADKEIEVVPEFGVFLSFDRAVEEYQAMEEWALDGEGLGGRYPLMSDGWGVLLVEADGRVVPWSSDDPELNPPRFASMEQVLEVIADLWEAGAFEPIDGRDVGVGPDHRLVRRLVEERAGRGLVPWLDGY